MGYPVDRRYGLTLVFADYSLLPDLLARVPRAPGLEVPGSWRQFLRENACNLNHTEEERIGDSGLIADGMAADAWRLARGLELVSKEGLTERGADLARLADTPLGDLTERDDQVLRVLLAEQLVNFYLSRGPSIARLLQEGARRLEGSESAQYCPGVLLVEVQALIVLAHTNPARAREWPESFLRIRDAALQTYPMPDTSDEDWAQLEEMLGGDVADAFHWRIAYADAITNYYLADLELVGMTLTEVRSTAMLLTFSDLLQERELLGPVQYLSAPPTGGKHP